MLRLARFRIAAALYGLAERCYDFGNRCSPPDDVSVPFDPEQWTDLGWTTDTDFFASDGWAEIESKMREASKAAFERYAPMWEEAIRVATNPIPESMWRDPAPRDIEGVKDVVRKAYEAGEPISTLDMTSFAEAAKQVKFAPFEETDVRPYMAMLDEFTRDLARQAHAAREAPMVDWLDDVGTVVPGFDAEAARQIIAERDRFLP